MKEYPLVIKRLIWLYFLLLIFEGGLRRWILPGLATPLLIVRDPIAVAIILLAWKQEIAYSNIYIFWLAFIGIASIFTAVFLGHGNLQVALFGARTLILHVPVMFIIGSVFSMEDVEKMGKILVWLAIPMTVLIAVQFYSPQSAWVNRGVGGDLSGAGFDGALGYFRPPATFSFIIGTSMFYSLVIVFILYFWFTPKLLNRYVLILSTLGVIAAIPLSISRTLFFCAAVSTIFCLFGICRRPKSFNNFSMAGIQAVIIVLVAVVLLGKSAFFQTGSEAFLERFENANEVEGGLKGVLGDRYLGGMLGALLQSSGQPFFGYGSGIGTNVGSMLFNGKVTYLIDEGEWGRLIGELGPLMGLAVIFIRLHLSLKMAIASFRKLSITLLPWLILSNALLLIPQGQWGQPTVLGFSTLAGGLLLASLKASSGNNKSIIADRWQHRQRVR